MQNGLLTEMRPLRSVLKRRPQSILSQQALAFAIASSSEDGVDSIQVVQNNFGFQI